MEAFTVSLSHINARPQFPRWQSKLLSSFNRLSNAPKSRHTAYDESCMLFSNNTYKMSEKAMEQCTINFFFLYHFCNTESHGCTNECTVNSSCSFSLITPTIARPQGNSAILWLPCSQDLHEHLYIPKWVLWQNDHTSALLMQQQAQHLSQDVDLNTCT